MALEAIVREKNAEDDDVVIRKSSLIYVPKWSINIRITYLKFFSFLNKLFNEFVCNILYHDKSFLGYTTLATINEPASDSTTGYNEWVTST